MFNKEKGRTWKIVNGILFLNIIIYTIILLVSIITELLPENGDYSNFVFNEFMSGFLSNLSIIIVIALTLLIINKKLNLFDKSYSFSRKFLNLTFVLAITGTMIMLLTDLFGILFNQYAYSMSTEIKNTIASILVNGIALYIINFKPILVTENSKSQNFFNYISICGCIGAVHAFILSILNISHFSHPIDLLRSIIIEITVFSVFAVVVYLVNFKKKNTENTIPKAFNIEK